jgi:hypothetical protein
MKRPGFLAFTLTALCGCVAGWSIGPVMNNRSAQDAGSTGSKSRIAAPRPTTKPVARAEEHAYFRTYFAGLPASVIASALHRGLFKEIEGLPVGEYCYCEMLTLAVADAAKKNPKAIFDDLVASRAGQLDGAVIAALFETWTIDAHQTAIAAVLSLPRSPRKDVLKNALITALASTHPQMAMDLYRDSGIVSGQFHGVHFHTLFAKLAKTDPAAALREFSAMRQGPDHGTAARVIATSIAVENPQAALRWTEGLTDLIEKETAVGDIFREVSRTDPAAVESLLVAVDDPATRASAIHPVFEQMVNSDPALLDRLINDNMTGTTLQTLRSNLVIMIQDPARFPLVTGILQQQPTGKNRDSLITKFADHWGTLSPQQTRDWLTAENEWERLPEEIRAKITDHLTTGNGPDPVKW